MTGGAIYQLQIGEMRPRRVEQRLHSLLVYAGVGGEVDKTGEPVQTASFCIDVRHWRGVPNAPVESYVVLAVELRRYRYKVPFRWIYWAGDTNILAQLCRIGSCRHDDFVCFPRFFAALASKKSVFGVQLDILELESRVSLGGQIFY